MLGSPSQSLVRAAAFVCTVYLLAVIGFVLSGWSLGDAAYMVMLTVSGRMTISTRETPHCVI